MTFHTSTAPHLFQELVDERIRGLQREAAEHRLASRVANANKARERAARATAALQAALSRL
uniref:hypothetical protein n=1 Tax=Herbidospora sakaeratensis TaxID=564415 RepID=UPI000782676C|nr:hypothetical protein [Herbidospora sakaeratensis]